MTIQSALIRSLEINGDKTAIEHDGKMISYSALFTSADKVTSLLLNLHVDKETVIGVCLQDRTSIIASIIGIMNAGCVFVLLDDSLPRHRAAAMLADLNLQYAIVSGESALVEETAKKGISLYTFEDILLRPPDDSAGLAPYPEYDRNDSLYIYFTSGSTGVPKGIVGKNCSLLQFLQWEIAAFGIKEGTRCSQFISPYFDAFLRDIFVPLLTGGVVCIPPSGKDFLLPERLVSWIDETCIQLIHCVPSLFRLLNNDSLEREHFRHLRYILLSGEKIVPSELTNWYNLFGPAIQLVNLYGATETTMIRSFYPISPEDVKGAKISIGSPIDDTELVVLDKDGKECRTLVPGELYIISEYVTKGYLNNPELTHERFLRLPAGALGDKIAFKTGDRARMLADSRIELLGREDRQVKLRGIRIELEEIESVLALSALVRNAAVIKQSEDNGDESLIAFIIANNNGKREHEWLSIVRQHLEGYLPEYMIPASLVELEEFSLLNNGKIDYNALGKHRHIDTIIEPVNEIESKILSIWKEILGDKPISTEYSFHKIGGNSLSIMKLIGRIYKEFNVRISLSELFNNLTIKKQAEFIKHSNKDLLYVISRSGKKNSYPLSSAQERMYYNQALNKENTSYNLPMAWEIKTGFDKEKIQRVFRSLIDRHEALRTEFRFENGELRQFIKNEVDFNIDEISAGEQDVDNAILDYIQPFDLGKAPLLRCGVISAGEGNKILVVDTHHIICDGMSQINLLSDFSSLYSGEELKPIDIQYKDYAEWESAFKATEEYFSHREFWLRSFEGEIPRIELPTINSAVNGLSDRGGCVTFEIHKATLASLLDHLHKEEMTLFSGLFSLYFIFLSSLTGQEDLVIGIATSGRMQQELEPVVGMFVKTLPIRYRMDPFLAFKDLLKDINRCLIQANSKQVYDLADIVIELNNNRAAPIKSLFDVVFVFQNFGESSRQKGNEEFPIYQFENSSSKYPLTLFASETENSFVFRCEYLSAYYTRSDIEILVTQFKSLAEKASGNLGTGIVGIIGSGEPATGMVAEDISFNF